MEPLIYAAIDLHSKTSTLGLMEPQGRFPGRKTFTTSRKNLIEYVRSIPAREKHLVVEQGNQSHWVACLLHPYVDKLVICDPKKNRYISGGILKTDPIATQKQAFKKTARSYGEIVEFQKMPGCVFPERGVQPIEERDLYPYADLNALCRGCRDRLNRGGILIGHLSEVHFAG